MTPPSPAPLRSKLAGLTRSRWLLALPLLLFVAALPIAIALGFNFQPPAFLRSGTPQPTPSDTPLSLAAMGLAEGVAPTPQNLPETQLTFRVRLPDNTPPDSTFYLTLLDEVTGLALNAQTFALQPDPTTPQVYTLSLPFRLGSLVRYRYERETAGLRVGEHVSNGVQVRYRLYHVEGPGAVEDVISRWTDTPYAAPTGRIHGLALDADSGDPLPNLLVAAGGASTLTTSDGSFLLEGLPPGTHNLVAVALDGSFRTFQQGATVAAESTTPAEIRLRPAPSVNLVFVVRLPADTPPLVPVRIAGSLFQTGNTFAELAGGVNSLAANMPVLDPLPDGRYSLTLSLPAGSDLRYKYTLGDGFWNAEHTPTGEFRLRQVVVPETNLVIEDTVDTWRDGRRGPITFDLHVPPTTPADDSLAVQFNPLFGWTEPLPMWRLGENRWAYILYSPLNLPGDLGYRYCRNGQCSLADALETSGPSAEGLRVPLGDAPQSRQDEVKAWAFYSAPPAPAEGNPEAPAEANAEAPAEGVPEAPENVQPRPEGFWTGVEFSSGYRPSWRARLPNMLGGAASLGGSWLVLTPSWGWTRSAPPVLEPVLGADATWQETAASVEQGRIRRLNVALFPAPRFPHDAATWWQDAPRDYSWWIVLFEQLRTFSLHHADLASRSGAGALILGGDWLAPALPGGTLADGTPSGAPEDAEIRWRNLIAEVRAHYGGPVLWAMPLNAAPPPFLDAVDGLYILWDAPITTQAEPRVEDMVFEAGRLLDAQLLPLGTSLNKPIVLGVAYPSTDTALAGCVLVPTGGCYDPSVFFQPGLSLEGAELDLQEQADGYAALLEAINTRPWVAGIISRGYYPAAALQDLSNSVHGKPAGALLTAWFTAWAAAQPAP